MGPDLKKSRGKDTFAKNEKYATKSSSI